MFRESIHTEVALFLSTHAQLRSTFLRVWWELEKEENGEWIEMNYVV